MVKSKYLLLFALLSLQEATAQLTLDKAYELARAHYPVIRQSALVKQSADYSIENLQKSFLPQLSLSGQASYQSDVTKVAISLPGFSIEPPSKDQYKVVADLNQLVYDGGLVREQKNLQQLQAAVETQKAEVELYKLREKINQLYMGVLFTDEQLKQAELVKADINTGINKVDAQVKNGVAFRSNLNVLKAELLKTEQRVIELRSLRQGLLDVLAVYIDQPLTEKTVLEKPVQPSVLAPDLTARPEFKLFNEQNRLFDQQKKLVTARNLPRASLFAQGGYGRPGLNMLKNDFAFYYIGGLRLSWSLGGLYTRKKEKEIADISKRMVQVQQETFELNTRSQLVQQQSEINKLQELVRTDAAIIDLRVSVKDAARAQLENGVITSNDYLREVNAEDQARQLLITHQLQLLQAAINYQTISGK